MALAYILHLSVKQRLIAIATTLSLATLLWLGNHATHTTEALDRNAVAVAKVETDMLMLRRHEKDFMARNDLKYQDKFNTTLDGALSRLERLLQGLDDNGIDSHVRQNSLNINIWLPTHLL